MIFSKVLQRDAVVLMITSNTRFRLQESNGRRETSTLVVGLGGNGTHVAATANIIVVTESENSGFPAARITPATWLRVGLPTTVLSLLVASVVYASFFEFFL